MKKNGIHRLETILNVGKTVLNVGERFSSFLNDFELWKKVINVGKSKNHFSNVQTCLMIYENHYFNRSNFNLNSFLKDEKLF